jgi:hypothetical protein
MPFVATIMQNLLRKICQFAVCFLLLLATLPTTAGAQVTVRIGESLTVQARDVGISLEGTIEAAGTLDTRGTTITFTQTDGSGGFQLPGGLTVELFQATQFQGTTINGPVQIQGALTLRVAEGTVIERGTVFTVLTCTGGCSGTFGGVASPFSVEVTYTANAVQVVAGEYYATSLQDARPPTWAYAPPAPNPFSDATVLRLELSSGAALRIEAYDLLGRRVDVVADAVLASGAHEFRWEAPRLASGVYILRAQVDGRVAAVWRVHLAR